MMLTYEIIISRLFEKLVLQKLTSLIAKKRLITNLIFVANMQQLNGFTELQTKLF